MKKVVLSAMIVFCASCFVEGSVGAMGQKQQVITESFIKYDDLKLSIPLKLLGQFEAYKVESSFKKKQNTLGVVTQKPSLKRSKSASELESLPMKKLRKGIVKEEPAPIVWDITDIVDKTFVNPLVDTNKKIQPSVMQAMRKKLRQDLRLNECLVLMINSATGAIHPQEIEDVAVLFMTIKMADLLGNTTIIQQSAPALMDKLMVKHPVPDWSLKTLALGKRLVDCCVHIQGTDVVAVSEWDEKTFEGWVKLWNYTTSELTELSVGHRQIKSMCHIKGTDLIALGLDSRLVEVWDYKTQKFFQPLDEHIDGVRCLCYLEDSDVLVSGSRDTTLKVLNYKMGTCLRTLTGHEGRVWAVTPLQKAGLIASGSWDATVKVWDCTTGECRKTLQGHMDEVTSIAPIRGTKLIAVGSADATKKIKNLFQYGNKTLHIWNWETAQYIRTLAGHTDKVWSVADVPGTDLIVSGGSDKTLRLWNYKTGECLRTLFGHKDEVLSVLYIPQAEVIISLSEGEVKVWSLNPFKNMSFEQLELCYQIFTSKKAVAIRQDSETYDVFKGLHPVLCKHILWLDKIKIVPGQHQELSKKL